MSKLKLNKNTIKKYIKENKTATSVLALALAGTITLSGAGVGIKHYKDNQASKPVIANSVGHTDINPLINFNLSEEDFVVLDMGDHNSVRTHFEKTKIKYCNEHDIDMGIIISSDATDEASIYDDVEYTKNLIRQYDFDFPVYLDINKIITNDDLNNEMKTKLIEDFVEKCTSNGMYVGFYGTDTNLARVKTHCGITGYDAFLVKDKEKIEYDGPYSVYQDLNGDIISKQDLSKVINKKGLNNQKRLINDSIYIVTEEDDITDIALKCGMSVNELLNFNNLSKKDVVPGIRIRIPSSVNKNLSSTGKSEYPKLENPIRGCDISKFQGSDIDWDKMDENFEFIIIKSNQGTVVDNCFENNALNASQNDIPIGAYCLNAYNLGSEEDKKDLETFKKEQQKQAELTLELLKNKKITYPVYFDVETTTNLDKKAVEAMLEIWVKTIGGSGYEPGLYCNQDVFKYLQKNVNYDLTKCMEVWIAGGDQYTGETKDIPLEEIVPPKKVVNNIPGAKVFQATDSAVGGGAGNKRGELKDKDKKGHLDINYSYYDYSKGKVAETAQMDEQTKEFTRIDAELFGITSASTIGAVALGYGIIGVLKKKEKIKLGNKVKTKTK